MLILDLWGISFHAVVVFGLGKNLLFKSILGLCARGAQRGRRRRFGECAVSTKAGEWVAAAKEFS